MMDKAKRYFKHIQFKNKQRTIKKKIEKEGLTDELLAAQVKLNRERHKHNISDHNNRIYKNYVQ